MQLCPEWFFFVVLVFVIILNLLSFMFINLQQTKRNEKYGLILGNWQLTVTSIFLISGQAYIMSKVLSAILLKKFYFQYGGVPSFLFKFWMHIHGIGLHEMANAIEFTEFTDHPISLDTILGLLLLEPLVLCSS
jgi:hypothetical protein